ncbi:glycosyltransferase family 2 protein [Lignipirellula cremea]|uniref:Undecaprenyl-phosphate mannosyltransferase n=1 Tax=Lignipirellula cremea TaxID=2528010 RepID=A0A518DV21_9BACT|nr:glycosyltransferase family 2 protein [Lignipirellula cremea]QDU95685.1 Undecaprenyl-phosphate mannosyltransferase [Lignipirellula cremea]
MALRSLTALPVYNEARHVDAVLDEVARYSAHILVVDDGSTDGTAEILARRTDVKVVTHERNRGYGAALKTAFDYALQHGYDVVVTIDCDGQHEPQRIPEFVAACENDPDVDIVSGSRYLRAFPGDTPPPPERRRINEQVTTEIRQRLGLHLTDAFCGFKAYRTALLAKLDLQEAGYAMPLQLWVQAAHVGLRITELAVPLIYLDEKRSFGGVLDDSSTRLHYYHLVLDRSIAAVASFNERPGMGLLSLCGEGCE